MAPKLPKLKRQPAGKAKPKAIGKANPTTPADRNYAWGGKQTKGAPTARKGSPASGSSSGRGSRSNGY